MMRLSLETVRPIQISCSHLDELWMYSWKQSTHSVVTGMKNLFSQWGKSNQQNHGRAALITVPCRIRDGSFRGDQLAPSFRKRTFWPDGQRGKRWENIPETLTRFWRVPHFCLCKEANVNQTSEFGFLKNAPLLRGIKSVNETQNSPAAKTFYSSEHCKRMMKIYFWFNKSKKKRIQAKNHSSRGPTKSEPNHNYFYPELCFFFFFLHLSDSAFTRLCRAGATRVRQNDIHSGCAAIIFHPAVFL